jgi:hypothetical protein
MMRIDYRTHALVMLAQNVTENNQLHPFALWHPLVFVAVARCCTHVTRGCSQLSINATSYCTHAQTMRNSFQYGDVVAVQAFMLEVHCRSPFCKTIFRVFVTAQEW